MGAGGYHGGRDDLCCHCAWLRSFNFVRLFALRDRAAATSAAQGYGSPFAFIAAIGSGLAIGCFNALLVCGLSINPFIATVGTGFIILGLDIISTPNTYITVDQVGYDTLGAGSWHGMPYKGIITYCIFGCRRICASEIQVRTIPICYRRQSRGKPSERRYVRTLTGVTYVFSGFSMGVAGILASSQLSSAQAQMEPTIVLDVIAIVVLGGTSLAGGFGAVWRTAVGLAIIATISNGFTLLGLNPFYQSIVKGTVIVLAVGFEGWARRLAAARLAKEIALETGLRGANNKL